MAVGIGIFVLTIFQSIIFTIKPVISHVYLAPAMAAGGYAQLSEW